MGSDDINTIKIITSNIREDVLVCLLEYGIIAEDYFEELINMDDFLILEKLKKSKRTDFRYVREKFYVSGGRNDSIDVFFCYISTVKQ